MKILVVDDHQIVLEGLATMLSRALPAAVLTAADAATAFQLLSVHADLDLVLLDLSMPGVENYSALTEIGRLRPELPIVVLSASEESRDVRKALELGALGYVSKSANPTSLVSAIRLVMDGEIYVPPFVVNSTASEPERSTQNAAPPRLTQRQVEVLRLLSEGHSNKVIATRLVLSEKTVKIHITAIFRILKVENRTQAAAAARRFGLL